MTSEEIKKAREIIDAATPGEWAVYSGGEIYGDYYPTSDPGDVESHLVCRDADGEPYEDAQFIAAARTGWLAALDEIERLQKLYEGCLTAPYAAELGKQYDEMQAEAEAWKAAALAAIPVACDPEHDMGCTVHHKPPRPCSVDECGLNLDVTTFNRALETARALESSHCNDENGRDSGNGDCG